MYQLSDYELSQLSGIDPRLSGDWQAIIATTLPKLDKDTRQSVMEKVLKPKGIRYDPAQKKLVIAPTPSLLEVCKANPTDNKQLLKAISQMMELISSPPPQRNL
ncbi:MAG: hypothetical protein Q3971_08840 [Moraxella sp.]|nr:hypothetical protein [Moraxella sp.]